MDIGFHLSSEEHGPGELIEVGQLAERLGFDSCSISDHFHPWGERQGHSPFVWSVLGGLRATTDLELGPLVTCPILRTHPAIIAHAASTMATMRPDKFFLGVGTGERLNEHVVGEHWPSVSRRLAMLEEAIVIMRELWSGELVSHHGEFFTVENARLFDVPDEPPPIYVAASGPRSLRVAADHGDGLVLLSPDRDLIAEFRERDADRPIVGMQHVCVADSKEDATRTVRHWWPTTGLPSALNAELPLPEHFVAAGESVPDDAASREGVLGAEVDEHVERLREYEDAGFDRVWIHQIGPDQERAARFYADEVVPALEEHREVALARAGSR
jgi:G6PDH family F420-dependent oxidoreductase